MEFELLVVLSGFLFSAASYRRRAVLDLSFCQEEFSSLEFKACDTSSANSATAARV